MSLEGNRTTVRVPCGKQAYCIHRSTSPTSSRRARSPCASTPLAGLPVSFPNCIFSIFCNFDFNTTSFPTRPASVISSSPATSQIGHSTVRGVEATTKAALPILSLLPIALLATVLLFTALQKTVASVRPSVRPSVCYVCEHPP